MGIADIISCSIKTLRGAAGKSLVAIAEGIGGKSMEGEIYSVPGVFGIPADGTIGLEVVINGIRLFIGTHNYKLDKALNKGETVIYSINNAGVIQAQAHFDSTGQIILNAGTDFAVKFNALQTAFNQLKTDHDNFLTEYKTHVHSGVTVGTGATGAKTPASTLLASTADIAPAKVAKVRL